MYIEVEAKATFVQFLFLLAAKKKAVIISFRQDTKILTADRTVGSAAVCKAAVATNFFHPPATFYNSPFTWKISDSPEVACNLVLNTAVFLKELLGWIAGR